MTIIIAVAAILLVSVVLALRMPLEGVVAPVAAADPVADPPRPFGYKMSWLAVKTEDPQSLIDCLRLEGVKDANWESGIAAVYDDATSDANIFVTSPVDGWTFVIGLSLPHPVNDRFVDKLTPTLMRLGAQYRDVQYFFTYPLIDFFAWARVSKGRLVRAFAVNDEGVVWNKGRITAEERALGLRLFELRGVNQRQGDAGGELVLYPTEQHVLRIARSWSLDPTRLGDAEGDSAFGLGIIAPTPYAWRPERKRRRAA